MEEKVLAFWEKNDIFKKSISQRDGNEEFVFYDGPPFATGPAALRALRPQHREGHHAPLPGP